ncbi:hypothetical protein WG922_05210 [Ramlibacter sp. AN1015]|uniref:hypothetical protein n=1 Tax=Ramlibacter sp. AN1015 TaxID=3133428 RepID=UPI0030BBCB9A
MIRSLLTAREPQRHTAQAASAPPQGEGLPEVYAPPEVVQGDGGDADWALWDSCVAALDAQVRAARAQQQEARS